MQLNANCIKDILLTAEEYCTSRVPLGFDNDLYKKYPLLTKYSQEEVNYHFNFCVKENFIKPFIANGVHAVRSLEPKGHSELKKIRN